MWWYIHIQKSDLFTIIESGIGSYFKKLYKNDLKSLQNTD